MWLVSVFPHSGCCQLSGGASASSLCCAVAMAEVVACTAAAEATCHTAYNKVARDGAVTEVACGIAVSEPTPGLACTELLHGAAVTKLVQTAAQPCGRVQALQTGPPLLCRPHPPGAQGSTAATAIVTRPPGRLCCPVSGPSVCLAGQSNTIVASSLNSCLTLSWKPRGRPTVYCPPTHPHHPSMP